MQDNYMRLGNLKPGMIFITNEIVFVGKPPQLHVYKIMTAPSYNTSFIVEALIIDEKKWQTRYWKSREWEWISSRLHTPSFQEQKLIIKTIFTATNK